VVSPLSVTCALYLLAAATDGAAQQEILDLLEIESDSDSDFESFSELIKFLLDQNDESYILNIANGIFYQETFSLTSDFTGKIQKMLQTSVADIKGENFLENPGLATRNINDWVSEKTMGKIPQLFDEALDSQERFKKH